MSDQKEWFLKDEQGRRFGPVTWETVVQWAADGRVSPLYFLSQGGQLWSRAIDFRMLGMTWLAELSPGKFYGPLPLPAIKGLIADGSLPANVRLYQRRETEDVPRERDAETEKLLQELRQKHDAANARIQSLEQALADASTLHQQLTDAQAQRASERAELETALAAARRDAAALEQKLADAQAQRAGERAEHEAALATARQNAAALEQKLADAQAQRASERAEHEAALAAARRNAAALEQKLADAQKRLSQGQAERDALAATLDQLKGTADALQNERDGLAREKQELARQTATFNSRFTAQQQRAAAAEQKAAALSLNLEAATRERDELRKKLDEQTAKLREAQAEEVVVEVLPPEEAEAPEAPAGGKQAASPGTPPFGGKGGNKLAALEAQVQRELAALQASGQMPDFLKR
ncbi:MAG: hypothetical protein J5985_09760 [Kiritimatiellae bacterium]|nr:hypothetical protein [Kiritimatiellia bacterium]